MRNFATYSGPIFSLTMCAGTAALSGYFEFGTKAPLIAVVVPAVAAVIFGIMVVSDIKSFWGPLFSGKPLQ